MVEEKVREGYKRTDVGVIPEDWEVKTLNEVYEITAGGDLKKDIFSLNKSNIYKFPIYSNGLQKNGLYGFSADYDYDGNKVTITARGTIGKANYRKSKFCAIGRLLVLSPKIEINNYLVSEIINNSLKFDLESTGVPQLTAPKVKRYKIKIPSKKPEQKAIAEVLSDTDDLTSSLQKLIDKKEKIKKGAMQKLLTGKERLPGFDGEWEEKTIKDVCEIYLGLTYTPKYVRTGIPFLSVKDIKGGKIDFKNIKYISRKEYENSTQNAKPKKNDILFGRVGTLGNPIVIEEDLDVCIFVSLGFFRVKGNESYRYFIKYWMDSKLFQKQIESKIAGSSQKNLNTGWLKSFAIKMPMLKEQKAIAQILSDMDAEIEALNKKLEKYKKIKQGMMEELLTGRIRLV